MKKFIKLVMVIFVCTVWTILASKKMVLATETDMQQEVTGYSYEVKDGKNYDYSESNPVDTMSFGKHAFGKLFISGSNIENAVYQGEIAYGVKGNVNFSYVFDQSMIDTEKTKWHVINEKEKKVAGRKLDSNIGNGVLIIQKSLDGIIYEDAVNPIVDFFKSNTSNTVFYKTAGEDIEKGMYYRVILAYKTEIQDGKFLFIPTVTTKYHVEVYDFFIAENSGQISIHNLSVDEKELSLEGYSQELLKHGETLEDGSVTRDGFSIEKITDSYTVKVARNDGVPCIASDEDKFTVDGKYTITVETLLGKKKTTTVYVFSGGGDNGFETYFSSSPVQAERVFREGDYPTYARGGRMHVQEVEDTVPVLYGNITNINTGSVVYELNETREEQYVELLPGDYEAIFYNSKGDKAGSFYRYNFRFTVIDEESAPYVNYHNLLETERLEDLVTKHYEVTYQTTGGGYIYVCFSMDSYEEALMYARDIEGRFVEAATDGGYYYKSIENANRKIKYYDLTELTKAREYYAKLNVEVNYFNSLDEFTYRTYDNNLLECLEELSLTESIKVFPSQEEKEILLERMYYINNFTFIQVSDYDVITVEALHKESGEKKSLEFGIPVSEQLELSGYYTITETNCYGKCSSYDVVFLPDCNTQMKWIVENDEVETTIDLSKNEMDSDNSYIIVADSAYITEIENVLDPWAIVAVKAPGVYSFEIKCLASEFKNLEFYKAGEYEITFIDRLGNSFVVKLAITGENSYETLEACNTSYVNFYNGLYLNPQNTDEDVFRLEEIIVDEEEDVNTEATEFEEIKDVEDNPVDDNNNEADTIKNANKEHDNISGEADEKKKMPVFIVICVLGGVIILTRYYIRKKRG